MWNSLIAGVVFQHGSIESLRRELGRNAALRQRCGFDPFGGLSSVPPPWAYTRFLCNLMRCEEQVKAMFHELVEKLKVMLPNLGEHLAGDGKAIQSHACKRGVDKPPPCDGRGDADADVGVKTYRGQRDDGSPWEKVTSWFGYQLNLLVDANYELPVAFELTKASASEVVEMRSVSRRLCRRCRGC